jgi:hypothetical protein
MVGYGATFPQRAHHRGASMVSIKADPAFVSCREGFDSWYGRQGGNKPTTPTNLLDGATDGGPDENDDFADERNNYEQTEAGGHHLQQRAVMTEDRLGVGVDQRLCILHFGINRA